MTVIAFDTLKLAERLEAAGFSPAQAKAQTEILAEIVGGETARLVTKQDLELATSKLESNLVRWVVTVGILQMALIAGLTLKLAG
jgi:hypothetical protein